MGFEIVNTYKVHYPALRLIGKRYTNDDRVNGSFGEQWSKWFNRGWFDELGKMAKPSGDVDNGYLGLMTINSKSHGDFSYWIGMFFPEGTPVMEGFDSLDLPESEVGINWIYGSDKNGEIYGNEPHLAAFNALCEKGWGELNENVCNDNTLVFFELYNCPRFTTPDHRGNVILDYGFYLKK